MIRPLTVSLALLVAFSTLSFGQDDHGNDASTATPVGNPGVVFGDIDPGTDADWFSFPAFASEDVTLETHLFSLFDSTLQLRGTDGTTLLDFDDDGGGGLASRINWTAPADGQYFAVINPFNPAQTGTYALTINSAVPEPSTLSGGLILALAGCRGMSCTVQLGSTARTASLVARTRESCGVSLVLASTAVGSLGST